MTRRGRSSRARGSVQECLPGSYFQPTLGQLPGWPLVPMAISANRSQLIWSPVVGWVLLTCGGSFALAQSETSSPAAQILLEQTPAVDVPDTPVSGAGPGIGTGEVGIAVGAFTLYPMLEVQAGYDSNVYATSAPTVGSPYTEHPELLERLCPGRRTAGHQGRFLRHRTRWCPSSDGSARHAQRRACERANSRRFDPDRIGALSAFQPVLLRRQGFGDSPKIQ